MRQFRTFDLSALNIIAVFLVIVVVLLITITVIPGRLGEPIRAVLRQLGYEPSEVEIPDVLADAMRKALGMDAPNQPAEVLPSAEPEVPEASPLTESAESGSAGGVNGNGTSPNFTCRDGNFSVGQLLEYALPILHGTVVGTQQLTQLTIHTSRGVAHWLVIGRDSIVGTTSLSDGRVASWLMDTDTFQTEMTAARFTGTANQRYARAGQTLMRIVDNMIANGEAEVKTLNIENAVSDSGWKGNVPTSCP